MTKTTVRVLVVDDYQAWHRFVAKTLQNTGNFQVVREVGDGVEAVREAEELQPDLVLLDIGLPSMNGLEAARRIRQVSPNAKILFVSENRSRDIVEAALETGAGGYVLKSDAGSDLLPGIRAVLGGKRFLSASIAGRLLIAVVSSVHAASWLLAIVSGTH